MVLQVLFSSIFSTPLRRQFSGAIQEFQWRRSGGPEVPFSNAPEAPFKAPFRRHTSAILGVKPTSFQASFAPARGTLGSTVQALFAAPFRRCLQRRFRRLFVSLEAPLEAPFFGPASRRLHAALKHCRRLACLVIQTASLLGDAGG